MTVIWSDRAASDVERIRAYLFERNPLAAIAVSASIIAAAEGLVILPRRYAQRESGFREMLVSRYHYVIRYELAADPRNPKRQIVHILSVWHPAQDR
ncbi:MAG: type II toxin-antitoxin system RelE/ParE family toxin [Rhodospirillales bacterium]|nr:type II toxin-antitoxin system RelE/ParE family toxin [Rhodospirillales bacterium]